MKIIEQPREIQQLSEELRKKENRIAFVPTMGYLHEGHLSLMREGKKRSDILVSSIFVNPTQFGPNEDLEAYPRDFEKDEKLMEEVGVDIVFYPQAESIYPEGYQTYINVEKVSQNLCGVSRPYHFRGVATVVAKLFNIVRPHIALFGQKDFQQLIVIQRMVKDLDFNIEVIGCPIVREPDGLAMSSRNAYLNPKERQEALTLKKALDSAKAIYLKGERKAKVLLDSADRIISANPMVQTYYLKICSTETMEDIEIVDREAVMAVAAFVGKTRLLDNNIFPAE